MITALLCRPFSGSKSCCWVLLLTEEDYEVNAGLAANRSESRYFVSEPIQCYGLKSLGITADRSGFRRCLVKYACFVAEMDLGIMFLVDRCVVGLAADRSDLGPMSVLELHSWSFHARISGIYSHPLLTLLIEVGLVWCLRGPSLLRSCGSGLLLTEMVGLAADKREVGFASGAAASAQNGVRLMVQQHLSLGLYTGANAFSLPSLDCRGPVGVYSDLASQSDAEGNGTCGRARVISYGAVSRLTKHKQSWVLHLSPYRAGSRLVRPSGYTTLAQTPAQPPLPAGPPNITKILEKAGQFTVFLRLLGTTQVGSQINGQLNNSNDGMTVFAPVDNAFSSLPSGTLNSLTNEQKVELVQFHVIPSFLSISQFQTVSNPVRTQAGDTRNGQFPLNVTTSGNQVNITTGIVNTTVDNAIYTDNQLAVYQVDKVLLPLSIFGTPPPAPAPSPASSKKKKSAAAARSPSSDDADSSGAVVGFSMAKRINAKIDYLRQRYFDDDRGFLTKARRGDGGVGIQTEKKEDEAEGI
ncbi:hypothetical protein U1Q18_020978 [Sarracenia purpurea var. burkii]